MMMLAAAAAVTLSLVPGAAGQEYIMIRSGSCDHPVMTLEQCTAGAAAIGWSYGAARTNDYSFGSSWKPPYCARIWNGETGAYYLNFDSAGSNTALCENIHACICFTHAPPTASPTFSPTASPTISPTASPTLPLGPTSAEPTSSPTKTPLTLSSCGQAQLRGIGAAAENAQYIIGDTVTIRGFSSTEKRCSNRTPYASTQHNVCVLRVSL